MDRHRLDRLSRRLAVAGGRRHLLRGAARAAASFVVSAPWRGASGQVACVQGCAVDEACVEGSCARVCVTDRDCRSKKKDDPCLINSCVDGLCVEAILDCLPGYECCERGACCPKPCAVDAECVVLDPCRWGRCGLDGLCAFTSSIPVSSAQATRTAAEMATTSSVAAARASDPAPKARPSARAVSAGQTVRRPSTVWSCGTMPAAEITRLSFRRHHEPGEGSSMASRLSS